MVLSSKKKFDYIVQNVTGYDLFVFLLNHAFENGMNLHELMNTRDTKKFHDRTIPKRRAVIN